MADDWAAAEVWLAILKARPVAATTLATYTREMRRLRWYCEQRQRPLPSAWTYQDTLAYGEFLQHEAHHHVCPPGLRPHDPAWTPFRSRLAPQSIAAAHKIVGQLFAFWQAAGYIGRSPYSGWGQARKVARESLSHRAVPPPLIELVLRYMAERKKHTPLDYLRYYRNRFVMVLLLGTGLRAHEAVACDMTDVAPYSDPDPAQPKLYWGLRLRVQKGGKDERTVYLDAPVMQALREYRRAFGLPPEPQRAETYGLVLSPLTERRQGRNAKHRRRGGRWRSVRCRQSAWGIIKAEFGAAAQVLRKVGKDAEASLLEQVSTHWLRHSLATDLVLRGHDIRLVAEVLRHDDIRTSMRYTHLGLIEVARALSGLNPRPQP